MDRRIDNLHMLRAIFTMGIVLDHINSDDLVGYGGKIFSIGTTGVAFFFVLSGFLMIYSAKPVKCGVYLKKRFLRIFPTLWVYILGIVILDVIFRNIIGWRFAIWTDINLEMVVRSWICYPIKAHSNEIVIPPAWTLSYEILFYVVGILMITLGEKIYYYVLSVWAAAIIIASLLGVKLFVLDSMFLELIIGVIVGCIFLKTNFIKNKNRILTVMGVGGGISLCHSAV